MIEFYFRSLQDENLKKIDKFRKGCLIYCFEPNDDDLLYLEKELGLDQNLLKDGLDLYEIPRIEKEKEKIYIFLRIPSLKLKEIFTTTLLVVISEDFFLIFSRYKNNFIDKFISENKISIVTTQKTKLFIQLLSIIYENFNVLILKINKEVRRIAFETSEVNEEEIRKIIRWEIILQDFLDALVVDKVIFNTILKQEYLKLFTYDRELIEDLFLKVEQLEEVANTSIKNIANIRSGYESIFTNYVNKILKVLTFFTILLSIPTMITSFFGMNLKLPLESNPYASFLVILISFFLMSILFLIFKVKKWL